MPGRNVIKNYVEGGYYHIYNRGVEKRNIFNDARDYGTFLGHLSLYLDASAEINSRYLHPDLSKDIDLLAYCLMPNHFHLLVKQKSPDGIAKLMRSVGTKYSMYFNRRYDRVGPLFQGTYKAALVHTNEQLMHLSRYIHLNPRGINKGFRRYPYSSYRQYFGSTPKWLKPREILDLFDSPHEYHDFVDGKEVHSRSSLGKLTLE